MIDGSIGEGGGQIVRTSLALSLVTGRPLTLTNIRSRRSKPGLRHQHLACVNAAAGIGRTEVTGACVGSSQITFVPHGIHPGRISLDIGTAGAAALVIETLAMPLSKASKTTEITVGGGTSVPFGPSVQFLQYQWEPMLALMGLKCQISLVRAGYYPKGGGEMWAQVLPVSRWSGVHLEKRGTLQQIDVLSHYTQLPNHVGERQASSAETILKSLGAPVVTIVEELAGDHPGTHLIVVAKYTHSQAAFLALGSKGKPAESVADEACYQLIEFHGSGSAVDQNTADQILLPLALAEGPSQYSVSRVTNHLVTNAQVITKFIDRSIVVNGNVGGSGCVEVGD